MLGERLPAARPLLAAAFVEAKHKRHPKGTPKGGKFARKDSYAMPPEQARQLADAKAFEARGKLINAAETFYSGDCTLAQLKSAYDDLVKAVLIRAEAG